MVAGWALSIFLVIRLNTSFHWIYTGVFGTLLIFLMARSYLIAKWKIWAFQSVGNLHELISSAQDLRIIRTSIFPNKWTICTKEDKAKLFEIIFRRLESGTTEVDLTDDKSLPSTFKIESSRKADLLIAIGCCCLLFKPIERLLSQNSTYPVNDYWFIGILTFAGLFFLYRVLVPNQIVLLSNSGVWTKKSDFQKWKAIDNIHIEHSIAPNQEHLFQLVIVFNDLSGIRKESQTQKFDIRYLNKNTDEIEYAIKIYKQRIKKSGHPIIEYSLSKKQDSNTNPRKEKERTALFLFIFPAVILAIGIFLLMRSNRSKEEYYAIKGKISYLGNSIGMHKNKSTRFLQIKDNPTVFKIFVGKESGDFSPILDKTAELNLNDEIVIYYGSRSSEKSLDGIPINKSAEYIEKDSQLYFHEGTKNKYFAYFILTIGTLLLCILLFMKTRKTA